MTGTEYALCGLPLAPIKLKLLITTNQLTGDAI